MKKDQYLKEMFEEKTKIMVIGIGEDVGTTTVSTCLAFYLAGKGIRTGFLQLAGPSEKALYLYYQFFMDKTSNWDSFYQTAKEGKSIRRCCNLMGGINWAIRLPQDEAGPLTPDEARRLVNAMGGQAVVCDLAQPYEELLKEGDMIFAIMDPMPYKLMVNMEKIKALKRLELDGYRVIWIANKMNKGVNMLQLRRAIKAGNIYPFPLLNIEDMYSNQYRGIPMNKDKIVREKSKEVFEKIFKKM